MSVGRNTAYNLIGAVLPLLLSLATVPAYLHLIGPDRYGVLAIAWLLLGYFGLFDLGLGRATQYKIAALRDAPPEERATTFWSALAVNVGMGVVGGVVLWIAAGLFFAYVFKVDAAIRPEIMRGVPFLAMAVPIATLTGVLTGALQGREKFLQTNMISVTSTTLFQLFPLAVAWWWGPDLPRLLAAAVAARLVAVAILATRCHHEIAKGHPRRASKVHARALLRFGGWILLTSVFGPMLVIVDRFMIGAVLGAAAVTVYSIPYQLAQRISIVPASLTNALFPRLSATQGREAEGIGADAIHAIAGVLTTPVIGAILLLEPFLNLWVGAELGQQAAPIGRLILAGFWCNAFALVPFIRLQASGRPDLVTKVLLCEIPPYLAALYFAMQRFGLIGLGAVFLARNAADFLLLAWTADRRAVGGSTFLQGMAAMAVAILLAANVSFDDWRFLAGSALLLGLSALMSWKILPQQTKEFAKKWRPIFGKAETENA